MDVLTFITKFIWPGIFVIFIFIFRKSIKNLIDRINRIKFKGTDITFDKDADKTLSYAERNIDIDIKDTTIKIKSPKLDIIKSWNELEKNAKDKLEELKIKPNYDDFYHKQIEPLDYLIRKGCFSEDTVNLIFDLRKIKNQAVHENEYNISENIAKRYISIINTLKVDINNIRKIPAAKVIVLNMMISILAHLIDTGKYNDITISDIHKKINDRTIIDYIASLDDRSKDVLSTVFREDRIKNYYLDTIDSYSNCADYSKHYGIKDMTDNTNGLLALLALTNEIIQQEFNDMPLYNSWE